MVDYLSEPNAHQIQSRLASSLVAFEKMKNWKLRRPCIGIVNVARGYREHPVGKRLICLGIGCMHNLFARDAIRDRSSP
jgi:hypothetical protein